MNVLEELNSEHLKPEAFLLLFLLLGLFNLRGSDVVYNPVFFAYALITLDEVT